MIESISIADIATYGSTPEYMAELSNFNFVFGSNGTGTTTISRIIADESSFPSCTVGWQSGTPLQPLVYNRDFVEENFNQSTELKGVFTLGKHDIDTLKKIDDAKEEIDDLGKDINSLKLALHGEDESGGKQGELATLDEDLKAKCWVQKQKHDANLKGAFEGYRGNSKKFMAKVLQERESNTATLEPLEELEKRAETVFGPTPSIEGTVSKIEAVKLQAYELEPILKKCVIGKDDVDIAAMIKRLGSSDWVRQGRIFYQENENVCPFCQQETPEDFSLSLNDYFDETFEQDSQKINELSANYSIEASRLQEQITAILAISSRFLDTEKLKTEKELLDGKIAINLQRLGGKKKEPSRTVELESVSPVLTVISKLIEKANGKATGHNKMVKNLSKERSSLTAQVWKYLVESELKADLTVYKTKQDALEKTVAGMNARLTTLRTKKKKKTADLRELEKKTTSIQPSIDGINALLSSLGFHGFSLAKGADKSSYKLIRVDGSDAKTTLSEGEKGFVTFLYFYHLLKGSNQESGMTTDRIVVFDDPVSSLDSDILFIVSSLIKGIFDEVRAGTGHIKQVFVFTHNVYFHKEVSFNTNRRGGAMNEDTFWVVRKPGQVSKLEQHASNPIKTSYELLWAEVRKEDRSNLTIQNTLRRILENYFKILGGVGPDEITAMFDGKEKMICRSLFSWVNDGSHFAHDDLYMTIDETMVEAYLNVFKVIFEKSGHLAHYKMMMGDVLEEAVGE